MIVQNFTANGYRLCIEYVGLYQSVSYVVWCKAPSGQIKVIYRGDDAEYAEALFQQWMADMKVDI